MEGRVVSSNPADSGGGGGSPGGDDSDGVLEDLRSGLNKRTAAALTTLAAMVSNVGSVDPQEAARAALGRDATTSAEEISFTLVGFAKDPLGFIWELLYYRLVLFLVTLILWLAVSLIDVIMLILVGDDLALRTTGQLGISDLIYLLFDSVGTALVFLSSTYIDFVLWTYESANPETGTLWDGVIRTIVFVVFVILTAVLLYRLIIAIMDAIPVISGVQTFLTGGS